MIFQTGDTQIASDSLCFFSPRPLCIIANRLYMLLLVKLRFVARGLKSLTRMFVSYTLAALVHVFMSICYNKKL